jgi:hypothetical protein
MPDASPDASPNPNPTADSTDAPTYPFANTVVPNRPGSPPHTADGGHVRQRERFCDRRGVQRRGSCPPAVGHLRQLDQH